MPDTPVEATPAVTPNEPAAPPQPTPQDAARAELYNRLYPSPGQNQTPAPEPAPQAQPDPNAVIAALVQEVQALKASIQAPPQHQQAPPADWFNLLQDGKRTEAEQALIEKVSSGASDKITREAMVQALEVFTANQEINNFNNGIRADNPDLLDVENLVSLQAEQYFNVGRGNVRSTKEFTELYKQSVNKAVESLRTTLQRTRAVAKAEERVTRREVLNSYTVQPNQITSVQRANQPAAEEQVPDTSLESYMAMRKGARESNSLPPDVRRQLAVR